MWLVDILSQYSFCAYLSSIEVTLELLSTYSKNKRNDKDGASPSVPSSLFHKVPLSTEGYDLEKLCACSIGNPDDTSLAERHCALVPDSLV
jgi:hypothetical protein